MIREVPPADTKIFLSSVHVQHAADAVLLLWAMEKPPLWLINVLVLPVNTETRSCQHHSFLPLPCLPVCWLSPVHLHLFVGRL